MSSEILAGDDRERYVRQQAARDDMCARVAYRRGATEDGRSFFAAARDLYSSAADDALSNGDRARAARYLQAEIALFKQLARADPGEQTHVGAEMRDLQRELKKLRL